MNRLLQAMALRSDFKVALYPSKQTREECEEMITALKPDVVREYPVTNAIEFDRQDKCIELKRPDGKSQIIHRQNEYEISVKIGNTSVSVVGYTETLSSESSSPVSRTRLCKSQLFQLKSGCHLEYTLSKEGQTLEQAKAAAQCKYSCRFLLEASTNMPAFWKSLATRVLYSRSTLPSLKSYVKHLEVLNRIWLETRFSEMEARFGHMNDGTFLAGITREEFYEIKKKLDSWKGWHSVTPFLRYKEEYVAIYQNKILTYRKQDNKIYRINAIDRREIVSLGATDSSMACRVAVKQEELVTDPKTLMKVNNEPISHSREKWRKRYVHKSGFHYDLTMVSASTDVYEFEIERMESGSTESFLDKISDFVTLDWDVV